jgi:hypothetical protein
LAEVRPLMPAPMTATVGGDVVWVTGRGYDVFDTRQRERENRVKTVDRALAAA